MTDDFKIITMQEIQSEEVQWLWEPYIPLGKITMIQGDPGDGKTTMILAIASAITTGTSLPCCDKPLAPADVIYQTAEDGLADTVKPRLEQLGADCGRVHVIDEEATALCLSDERIERAIIRTGAKLFVLDPMQAYLGGTDFHSANSIRPLMKSLGAVAERTGCAIVIVGHLNKSGSKSQYRGLGSIDIHAAARSVLTVGRINVDEHMRAFVHGKSNLAPCGSSIAFGLDPKTGFCWLGEHDVTMEELLRGGSTKTESQSSKAKRLIETMLAHGPVAAKEIMCAAEEQGISPKTLNRVKSSMGVQSYKKQGQWFWVLPIEADYTVSEEDGQGGHGEMETSLTILPA